MYRLLRSLALLPVVLLASCSGSNPPSGGPSGPPTVGRPALEISGVDIDGQPLQLRDFRGKVVLLSFWFSS